MLDLTTSVAGLQLAHPFIAGASPLGRSLDAIRRLEDGGCSAIVLPSLFEEQITQATEGRVRHSHVFDSVSPDWMKYFPTEDTYAFSPTEYAEHVRRARAAVQIPIIASLNGTTAESWLKFATTLEQAGAHALELNMYEAVANTKQQGSLLEYQLFQIASDLKRLLKIPIVIKLSPFFTSFGNVAARLDLLGVDALVLFNRFYQWDIDIDQMTSVVDLRLSSSDELVLRLRWVSALFSRLRASLVLSGGVAAPEDGIKAILAGADGVQVVSGVLREGPAYFQRLTDGLSNWMSKHGVSNVGAIRGRASLKEVSDPAAFERAAYLRTLQTWRTDGHELTTK